MEKRGYIHPDWTPDTETEVVKKASTKTAKELDEDLKKRLIEKLDRLLNPTISNVKHS